MRKRLRSRNGPGNGRNRSLLLRRLENCKQYQSVDDIVKFLHSRYPDYKRINAAILSKNIQGILFESKDKSKRKFGNDYGGEDTSSSSFESCSASEATTGQVSNPKFDLMKSMLREGLS